MTSLTIRRIKPELKDRLRLRASRHGRSLEEEARQILSASLAESAGQRRSAFDVLREPFAGRGDVTLNLPDRSPPRDVPDLD